MDGEDLEDESIPLYSTYREDPFQSSPRDYMHGKNGANNDGAKDGGIGEANNITSRVKRSTRKIKTTK